MRKSARQRVLSAVLALLFLPFSVVSAGVRHAHAGSNQPADHNARPHIHVGHSCHVGHPHHHDADGSHSRSPASETKSEPDDHDSDAVYLPSEIGATLLNKSVRPPDNNRVTATAAIAFALSTTTFVNASETAFFPDEFGPACPLYLALRGLRI